MVIVLKNVLKNEIQKEVEGRNNIFRALNEFKRKYEKNIHPELKEIFVKIKDEQYNPVNGVPKQEKIGYLEDKLESLKNELESKENKGYVSDEDGKFIVLEDIPLNSAIETITEDYQGNLWLASTRQGVAKIVTNNFEDVTKASGLDDSVVNTTCLYKGILYIGTDDGLKAVDREYNIIENTLTHFLEDTRIRCIIRDRNNDLWIATYNNSKGLVCYHPDGTITSYTEDGGFISNGVRSLSLTSDGSVLVGTNGGTVLITDGKIKKITSEVRPSSRP